MQIRGCFEFLIGLQTKMHPTAPLSLISLLLSSAAAAAPALEALVDELYSEEDRVGQECWTAGGCQDNGATACDWCGGTHQFCCRSDWQYNRGDNCYAVDYDDGMRGHHQCVLPSSTSSVTLSLAADVLALAKGILIGFGEETEIDLESCLIEGPEDIFDGFQDAVDKFREGSVSSVINGLSDAADAVSKIVSTLQVCGSVKEDFEEEFINPITDAIESFKHPIDVVVQVGRNLIVNGADIWADVVLAVASFQEQHFQLAGEAIGRTLVNVIAGR